MKKIVLLLTALLILGCMDMPRGKGKLEMLITNSKPSGNITNMLVSISDVEVQSANGTWSTFLSEAKSYDILALNGTADIIGESGIGAGNYGNVSFNLDSVKVTEGGATYDASLPSRKITLSHPFVIDDNDMTSLIVDFGADNLVSKTGAGAYAVNESAISVYED